MKAVFEFTKTGDMIYISHLDLGRLFLRVLRMSGLRPAYSQGFNPHPKMSFAMPLSLGIHSVCEILEFETEGHSVSLDIVNDRLPDGVRVTSWREKPEIITKPLASLVTAASYEYMCEGITEAPSLLESFFKRESVTVQKTDKKTGTQNPKDIREEMLDYRIIKDMRGRMLAEATLSAMPGKTLNPLVFFGAFCESSGIDKESLSPVITRTAILGADSKPLKEVLQ